MNVIESAWLEYRKQVMPVVVSNIQYQESRRAFYGGAMNLLASLVSLISPGKTPTDEDMRLLDGINTEFAKFTADVNAGRA